MLEIDHGRSAIEAKEKLTERYLSIPGPTNLPPEVLEVMGRQPINQRGPEFAKIFSSVTKNLKDLLKTDNDVLIFTGSGTLGLEATVVNTLSPGDKVLALSIGDFGNVFAEIAHRFGANVIMQEFEWGTAADPDAIKRTLDQHPDTKAVLVTHNETSTGVTNPIEEVSNVVRNHSDALLLVDAVSGPPGIDLKTDKWGCDVVISASQKGWGVPPGLTMISVSPKAWEAYRNSILPKFYYDFARGKQYSDEGFTPFTPAIMEVRALDVASKLLLAEGHDAVLSRHARTAQKVRDSVDALGLEVLAKTHHSSTVTTVIHDNPRSVIEAMRHEGVEIAGGRAKLAERTFRIGHMGYFTEGGIDSTLSALERVVRGKRQQVQLQ